MVSTSHADFTTLKKCLCWQNLIISFPWTRTCDPEVKIIFANGMLSLSIDNNVYLLRHQPLYHHWLIDARRPMNISLFSPSRISTDAWKITFYYRSPVMPLLYSVVARGPTVLAKYAECTGNFEEVTEQILAKIPPQNDKMTYSQGPYLFHYVCEDRIIYMCITDDVSFLFCHSREICNLSSKTDWKVSECSYLKKISLCFLYINI